MLQEICVRQMNTENNSIDSDIARAVEVLKRGGVILYPTDTVWGIGCDATRSDAVKRIFEIKKRADSKAMIVLLDKAENIDRYVDDVPEIALQLIEVADRPTTIVFDGARNVAKELVAEDGSIGIRITNEEFSNKLCKALRKPLVSTSANISGQPSARIFPEICDEIKNSVDYIATTRRDDTTIARPSCVIKVGEGGQIKILRK